MEAKRGIRAITVQPGIAGSVQLGTLDTPAGDGAVIAKTLAMGVCETDRDIIAGEYGSAPPGQPRLVLGHESLARVLEAPGGSGLWHTAFVRRAGDVKVVLDFAGA